MPEPGRSLWKRIPRGIWLEIVPIVTTALFVSNGEATAELVTRLREGKGFGESISAQAVADLSGILLLVNFVVVLWFGYRTLNEALSKAGSISLTAKLVGIGAAVVTSGEVYARAVKSGQPERMVFCLLILFYVFAVPFFLLRTVPSLAATKEQSAEEERGIARQALAAMEIVVYAVASCVAAVLVCSLYFVGLNEGIRIAGQSLVPSFFEGIVSAPERIPYWGFNPGILGIGWLTAVLLHAASVSRQPDGQVVGLDARGRMVCRTAAYGFSLLLALALVADESLRPAAGTNFSALVAAKAGLGLIIMGAFLLAHRSAMWIDQRRIALPIRLAGQIATFALAGALVGLGLIGIRLALGGVTSSMPTLVGLHAVGFVLAFISGRSALAALRRWFAHDVEGVLGSSKA